MKYTSILVACLGTASLVLGESFEYKQKCNAFMTKSNSLTSQNNARNKRAIFGRRKKQRNEAPFVATTAFASGDDEFTTMAEVSTPEVTTILVVTTVTQEVTTEQGTTEAATTSNPTTTEVITTNAPTTDAPTTIAPTTADQTTEQEPESETPPEYVIVLDETGSMQRLGGKQARKGREIIIKKFNKFLDLLKQKINDGEIVDGRFTFVTFNRKARIVNFDSLLDMPSLSRASYNPGYGTNLYDTLACVISGIRSDQPDAGNVKFYVISDGAHKLAGRKDKKYEVGYEKEDLANGVTEAREFGWDFSFYGAVNDGTEKDKLKSEVLAIGFRETERKMFDFTGGDMNKLLKSLLSSMGSTSQSEVSLPECKEFKKCKKGKAGKWCRKGRKSAEAQGKCKFY